MLSVTVQVISNLFENPSTDSYRKIPGNRIME